MDSRSSSTVASSSSIGIGWSSSTCAASKPAIEQPPGVEITTLAARPDLLTGPRAALAFPDIPHADEPMQAGSLEEFGSATWTVPACRPMPSTSRSTRRPAT